MTEPIERPAMRASNTDRERIARILHDALSEGRITVQEMEERLDAVYAAKTLAELEPPIADLPAVSTDGLAPAPPRTPAVDSRIGGPPGSSASIAIMSGASRKGSWVVPHQHTSFAFWSGVELDLRSARFAGPVSTITAVAIMGGIEIKVPDDIVIEIGGIGFMGAFEIQDKDRASPPPPNAPVVRINGLAFWGAVSVIRKPRRE